ncbi:MAG TPA: response regulator [Blastocatellia bacterium]|nr:response regulator [Blastocatellia bacterium]
MNCAHLILIVEDHQSSRGFLRTLFRLEGYDVIEAGDGEEALTLLSQRRPDLIITDLMMPGMSGLEFIRRVRAQPGFSDIPVVVTSAIARASLVATAGQRVESYLRKPLDTDSLVSEVKRLLASTRWQPHKVHGSQPAMSA